MCLIVDINIAQRVFLAEQDSDFEDIQAYIFAKKSPHVKIHYGGKLAAEYAGNHDVTRIVAMLDRQGWAIKVDDAAIDLELQKIAGLCCSNDEHIIALARASGVRLLCTHDQALHTDFTNKALIDNKRGKVYQNRSHNALIPKFCK